MACPFRRDGSEHPGCTVHIQAGEPTRLRRGYVAYGPVIADSEASCESASWGFSDFLRCEALQIAGGRGMAILRLATRSNRKHADLWQRNLTAASRGI